ncbi:MAG: hypothetical protein IJT62_06860 [Oscillospiraceae bacterium]|nr:hypothetical protein [Oscillospiraceae bacterium]
MAENKNPMELLAERDKIFYDFYHNVTPERMPVISALQNPAVAGYCGQDLMEWHYNSSVLFPAYEKLLEKLYSDVCPFMPPVLIARPATPYQILGSQSFVLAANGLVQHPEVVGMVAEEYPELIEKGFDFLVEKVIPRQYKNMGFDDPAKMAYTMQLQINERNNEMQAYMPQYIGMCMKMGYHNGGTLGTGGFAEAPFDFLADQLRSFSQISVDVRRRRSEVAEAVEALTPIMWKMGRPPFIDYQANVFYPLHMPTFMREKDVRELYMPTFKRLMEQDAAHGVRPWIFIEDDWTRYLDLIYDEFPAGCVLRIDEGDPQAFKDKLGKKFILEGMFPFEYMRTCDTPKLLDKAKEFLDIMLPGCGYLFTFNKGPLVASDMDFDKYCDLTNFVRDYSHWANAGEPFGTPLNSEGYQIDPEIDKPLKSRLLFNWDEYKAANPYAPEASRAKLEAANAQAFSWYINLLA